MAASIFESPLLSKRYPTGETGRLFTDAAEVRALLLVAGTLAKVQGKLGHIPEDSAFFIHRAAMEVQIDPAGLAVDIAKSGEIVTALRDAFARALEAPEHSGYILNGMASQNVIDTAIALRLRQFLSISEKALTNHMLPEADVLLAELMEVRKNVVSIAFDAKGPEQNATRSALAKALRLGTVEIADRSGVLSCANWAVRVCGLLAKQKGAEFAQLAQLTALASALYDALETDHAKMVSPCLAQICLCAAAALEISKP
ncbi:hypothetical protein [Cognatishimia sp. WU-CL00825]|uniref:hypothetical protein n=1 Tax=Cognatishimia sp. WU-CL00825 TaxID=3127658 RepID=UPI0033655C26